jgi:hypothetical protein
MEDISDPAKGAKVPRCRSCGLPDQVGNRLLHGSWVIARFSMPLELCERCVASFKPDDRRAYDPLDVSNAA